MRFLRRFIARLSNSVTKRREDERMREEIEEHPRSADSRESSGRFAAS